MITIVKAFRQACSTLLYEERVQVERVRHDRIRSLSRRRKDRVFPTSTKLRRV